MNKFLTSALVAITLLTTACTDINVTNTQVTYLYQKDIYDSKRYNTGSDWTYRLPFNASHKKFTVDYGVQQSAFSATYTLDSGETKISIPIKATVIFEFIRNPKDTDGKLSYSDDTHVQFWAQKVGDSNIINAKLVYDKLMQESEDTAFREAFMGNAANYKSFDDFESNILNIRKNAKKFLMESAKEYKIKIIGVRLEDLTVPLPIKTSREENLNLQQSEINQTREIEMRLRLATSELVVRMREAINDVMVDKIVASQIDKGYLLIEVLREAAKKGGLNISITPDFMRYIDTGGDSKSNRNVEEAGKMFDKLTQMSDKEMTDFFTNKKKVKK
jgi:hypothetical protein